MDETQLRPLLDEAVSRGANADQIRELHSRLTGAAPVQEPQQPQATAGDYLQQVAKGGTFGLSDEIGSGLAAGKMALDKGSLSGIEENYNVGLQGIRSDQANFEHQHPIQSLGLQLLGGAPAALASGGALAARFGASNLATRMLANGVGGAASGGLYGFGTGEGQQDRLQSAGQGALAGGVLGAALPVAPAAVGQVGKAIVPDIEQGTAQLAKRAEDFGIPLRLDQISPTRARQTVQKVSQEMPFSGVDAFDKKQTSSFNSAVAKTIGQDSDNLSPNVIQSFRESNSGKFDEAFAGQNFNVGQSAIDGISQIGEEAKSTIDLGLSSVVNDNINKVIGQLGSGSINGEKLSSIRSELLKRMTRMKNAAAPYVGDIIDKLDDIAESQMSPDKLQMLGSARREYRNFKTIQPLLEKSTDGNINPTQLINRVASSKYIDASKIPVGEDDLVDLARIGKQFMPKLGGSDTFQKGVLGGGLGTLGATAFINPAAAISGAGSAAIGLGANRLFQSGINQSQGLVRRSVNKALQFPKNINRVTVRPSDANLPVR